MTISAQVIDTIVEWIDDNLNQPLRIDDIARHAGYSKWHLQRLFMQYKGESLGRYVRERKLKLAARDLRDTDQKVYDICLKYGFDSQQTFTRIFTRTFNLPPGAYRKEKHGARIEMLNRPAQTSGRQIKRITQYSSAPSNRNHKQNSKV
ncbi:transcriptional activator RamA [Salmonella enterica subsp. arizonae]|uniref:Transcriptional activator RamA n=3 Tax=Salmonella enterica TaxID=28901 RepID=A0A379S5Z1_SALER|nr:transcriptional activator RamA [Salmonella enterica subsp. arizonae]